MQRSKRQLQLGVGRSRGVGRSQAVGAGNGVKGTNSSFANAKLFALHTAWQSARQSRRRNHRLESRMRENRPYGSEGGVGANRSRPLSAQKFAKRQNIAVPLRGDSCAGPR